MRKIILLCLLLVSAVIRAENVLTPTGYQNAAVLNVGDLVIGNDNGTSVIDTILKIERWTELTDTSNQGAFTFYKINNRWNLYKNQSLRVNGNVSHAFEVNIGDTIYDGGGSPIIVNSIVVGTDIEWYRFVLSGTHTYIADGLLLHNASRFWVGGGSSANWSATANTNWSATSGGSNNASVPGSADDVTFDGAGASGNTNSTISATITTLSFTNTAGYTHTITTNANYSIAGNMTLNTGILWAGSSAWQITATSTITSNGVTFVPKLNFTAAVTVTLSGNFTVSGLVTFSGAAIIAKTTAETLTLSGGVTLTSSTGICTAKFILTGGTWTGPNFIVSNVDLQGNITVSGSVGFNGQLGGNTLHYVSGTITTTSSTLLLNDGGVLNTNGMTWAAITVQATSTSYTLTSNLACSGNFTFNVATVAINHTTAETVTVGGLTVSNGTSNGSAVFIMTGGTWSGAGLFEHSLQFNGNVTVSGSVFFAVGTLTYTSGTITTTSSTLTVEGNATLNCAAVTWNNLTFFSGSAITLSDNMTCTGLLTLGNGTTTGSIINGGSFTVTSSGGITFSNSGSATYTGTANIKITGGTLTPPAAAGNAPFEMHIEFAGNVTFAAGTFDLVSATVVYTSGTYTHNASFILFLTSSGGSTITNNNSTPFTISTVQAGMGANVTQTWNGSQGISIGELDLVNNESSTAFILVLTFGNTYTITTKFLSYLSAVAPPATHPLVKSSSAGNKVALTLSPGASQNIERLNFTDVDASGGQTIYDYSGSQDAVTLTNTLNINKTPTAPVTVSHGFNN